MSNQAIVEALEAASRAQLASTGPTIPEPVDKPQKSEVVKAEEIKPFGDEAGIPCYYKEDFVMTRTEAAKSRSPGLRERMCVVVVDSVSPVGVNHYLHGSGTVAVRTAADVITVRDALNSYYVSVNDRLLILNQELLKQRPPTPKFHFEEYASDGMISLIDNRPKAKLTRELIRSVFCVSVPDDIVEPAAIKHWITCNGKTPAKRIVRDSRRAAAQSYTLRLTVKRSVQGTCKFTATQTGIVTVSLSSSQISEAYDAGDGFEDGCDNITNLIEEMAAAQELTEPNLSDIAYQDVIVERVLESDIDTSDFDHHSLLDFAGVEY
jgi:hypothetical protein